MIHHILLITKIYKLLLMPIYRVIIELQFNWQSLKRSMKLMKIIKATGDSWGWSLVSRFLLKIKTSIFLNIIILESLASSWMQDLQNNLELWKIRPAKALLNSTKIKMRLKNTSNKNRYSGCLSRIWLTRAREFSHLMIRIISSVLPSLKMGSCQNS